MDGSIEVAVIEEDADLRRLFRDILADAGFVVRLFADDHALPPRWTGVVVTDSGGNVYERETIARRMRALRERSAAKIVLVSAHSEVMRDAERFGADAVLRKPFHIDELLSVVESVASELG